MTAPRILTAPPPPFHRCSRCPTPAIRYLPGHKRTFYCGEHGPSKVTDWQRLVPLTQDDSPTDRAIGTTQPIPDRAAALIEHFVEGMRLLFQQAEEEAADPDVVAALQRENADLRTALDRAMEEARSAESIADEVLSLWTPPTAPTPAPEPEAPPPQASAAAPPAAPADDPNLEARFPKPPPPEPTRAPPKGNVVTGRGADGTISKPRLVKDPARPSKGYILTPPVPTPHHAPEPEARTPTVTPPTMPTVDKITLDDVQFFNLDAILLNVYRGEDAPGLACTRRALKAYETLAGTDKLHVVRMFEKLGRNPKSVQIARIEGTDFFALRASGKLRVLALRQKDRFGIIWTVVDITNRGDSTVYRSEK